MKKVAFSILLIAVVMFACVSGCSNNIEYKYADNWKPGTAFVETTSRAFWDEVYAHSEEVNLDSTIALLKDVFFENFSDRDFDWENLTLVKTARYVSVHDPDEVSSLSQDLLAAMQSCYAMYDDETKCIYLLPNFINAEPEEQVCTLIHELAHAAFKTKRASQLEEGLAEYYTCLFTEAENLAWVDNSYPDEGIAISWLIAIFGEDEVLHAARDGMLQTMIDEATKPGLGNTLEEALTYLHYGDKKKAPEMAFAANTMCDILAHLAASKGADVSTLLSSTKEIYSKTGINIDARYVESKLKSVPKNLPGEKPGSFLCCLARMFFSPFGDFAVIA